MCGDECLIGVTSLEAWDILTKAPLTVEFTLTRRKDIPALLGNGSSTTTPTTTQPSSRPQSLISHKRRMSYSLHFSADAQMLEDIRNVATMADYDTGDEDTTTTLDKTTSVPPPTATRTSSEEYFTVVLSRSGEDQRLGLGIHGGKDHPQLPGIYVS